MSQLTVWQRLQRVQWAAVMWVLVMLLSVLVVYRAWTMAFTIDEAYSYQNFSSQSTRVILNTFHSNHHMLFTMLSKVSWKFFGVSELTLRLPAVLGGIAFLILWAALARVLTGGGWLQVPVFALAALNPLLLDLLSAGRGYSLAMAFWTAAALLLLRTVRDSQWRTAVWAGVGLGLSVAANLAFLIPAAALVAAALAAAGNWSEMVRRATAVCAPFLATVAVLLGRALRRARAEEFYLGSVSWGDFFESVVAASMPGWEHRAAHITAARLLMALSLLATGGSVVYCLLRVRRRQEAGWVVCLTLAVSVVLVEVAHRAWGIPYPYTRTGIYLLILVAAAGAVVARLAGRWATAAWVAAAVMLTAAEVWAIRVDYLGEWVTDADNRAVAARLRQVVGKTDRVCASWELEPGLNYYRAVQKWPVVEVARLGGTDCTVLVLLPADHSRAAGGAALYRGARSGVLVIRRQ